MPWKNGATMEMMKPCRWPYKCAIWLYLQFSGHGETCRHGTCTLDYWRSGGFQWSLCHGDKCSDQVWTLSLPVARSRQNAVRFTKMSRDSRADSVWLLDRRRWSRCISMAPMLGEKLSEIRPGIESAQRESVMKDYKIILHWLRSLEI